MIRSFSSAALMGMILTACAEGIPPYSNPPAFADAQIAHDADGRCYGRVVTPALIQTVTDQVMVQPPEVLSDGTVTAPAAFRTVTRQEIVRERREVEFEAVCPADMTPEFIASLQRALTVRGYYSGSITGILDSRTRRAIQAFQGQAGMTSHLLDIRTARELGLIERTAAELGLATVGEN